MKVTISMFVLDVGKLNAALGWIVSGFGCRDGIGDALVVCLSSAVAGFEWEPPRRTFRFGVAVKAGQ